LIPYGTWKLTAKMFNSCKFIKCNRFPQNRGAIVQRCFVSIICKHSPASIKASNCLRRKLCKFFIDFEKKTDFGTFNPFFKPPVPFGEFLTDPSHENRHPDFIPHGVSSQGRRAGEARVSHPRENYGHGP